MVNTSTSVPPAKQLAGLDLKGGWKVVKLLGRPAKSTGGHFSSGYIVEHLDGTQAFLKALDYTTAFKSPDPARALQALTESFNFERDILFKCKEKRLSRIVQPITQGTVTLPGIVDSPVQYIIFELADIDARLYLDAIGKFDVAWRLRALHHVATGLEQLHNNGIAHQDLKPSNVLFFEKIGTSKIADLGRASSRELVNPFDGISIPGDKTYAPLELLYSHIEPDWNARRMACDAYLLGSLVAFFFTGVGMTPAVIAKLDHSLQPKNWIHARARHWTGSYGNVLAHVRNAFGEVLQDLASQILPEFREDLVVMMRQLCEPDPALRGDPRSHREKGNSYSLRRYVSKLDLLAKKAEIALFRHRRN